MRVTSLDELVEAVRGSQSLRISGGGTGSAFRNPGPATESCLAVGLSGIVSHDVSDQVVTVWAGTPISEFQEALRAYGQCLPIGPSPLFKVDQGTVGGRLSLSLPHGLEADCGNWRDWILGMTVVTADGIVAKAGSKAVKNVAGYDVFKLLVGARGTLAVIAQVILRTFPVKALPEPDLESSAAAPEKGLIQHTLTTDFAKAAAEPDLIATHPKKSVLYRSEVENPKRLEHDRVLRWGCGDKNLTVEDPTVARYMRRAKELFDPTNKLNPGEMGVV